MCSFNNIQEYFYLCPNLLRSNIDKGSVAEIMLLASRSRNLQYEQKSYEFSVQLYSQTLRLVLQKNSSHQTLDKFFVKETIPLQLRHQIKNIEDFYNFFENPENYLINVAEKKIQVFFKNKKNIEQSSQISLIEVKAEENDQHQSIIIHDLPMEEAPPSDYQKRISELEKLVIGLVNSQNSQSIKLQQKNQKDQFLRKSEFVDFAKNLLKEEQKKFNQIFLKKSTRQTVELRQEIQDISNSLEESIHQGEKVFLFFKDNQSKRVNFFEELAKKWEQRFLELEAQSLKKNSRIKKLEDDLEALKCQVFQKNEILSGYNPRKRLFSDYSYEPAVRDGKVSTVLEDDRMKNLQKRHNFDERSEFLKFFNITQNLIQYVGENRIGTQILLQKVLDFEKVERFKIKVVNSQQCFVKLGIIDRSYIKERSSWSKRSPRCILYSGASGDIYESGKFLKSQGSGFQKGLIVQMKVNLQFGMIQWICEGYEARIFSEQIRQRGVSWVPVIQMSQTGDAIQLIE